MAVALIGSTPTAADTTGLNSTPITTSGLAVTTGDLLVVFVGANGTTSGTAVALTITNSGTAQTWTRQVISPSITPSTPQVVMWSAISTVTATMTATITKNVVTDGFAVLKNFRGHNTTTPIPSGNAGAVQASGPPSHTTTPSGSGSQLWLLAADVSGNSAPAAGTGMTVTDTYFISTFSSGALAQPTTSPSGTAAVSMTMTQAQGDTTSFTYGWLEIQSAIGRAGRPVVCRQAVNRAAVI